MGTASSVSCMLEAVNRELSSLIYLHIEDMEKNSLLAYFPAYSNICDTRRRIWGCFVLQISVPLNKGCSVQPFGISVRVSDSKKKKKNTSPYLQAGGQKAVPAHHHGYLDFMSSGHLPHSTSESALAYLGHVGLTCQLLNKLQHAPPKLLAWSSTQPQERQAKDTAVHKNNEP